MSLLNKNPHPPIWFWLVVVAGLAWNIFGVVQFLASVGGDVGSMMSRGLTQQQAELYARLPVWMNGVFAVGVFGGVIGCLLLLLRKALAVQVFGVSLIGYIILFIGDITEGVFAVFGVQQVAILSTVILIATALLGLSLLAKKKQWLR